MSRGRSPPAPGEPAGVGHEGQDQIRVVGQGQFPAPVPVGFGVCQGVEEGLLDPGWDDGVAVRSFAIAQNQTSGPLHKPGTGVQIEEHRVGIRIEAEQYAVHGVRRALDAAVGRMAGKSDQNAGAALSEDVVADRQADAALDGVHPGCEVFFRNGGHDRAGVRGPA